MQIIKSIKTKEHHHHKFRIKSNKVSTVMDLYREDLEWIRAAILSRRI